MEATYSSETSVDFQRTTCVISRKNRTLCEISLLLTSRSEGWDSEIRTTVLARTIRNLAVSQSDPVEINITGETFSVVQNSATNTGSSENTPFFLRQLSYRGESSTFISSYFASHSTDWSVDAYLSDFCSCNAPGSH
jgi:hypothetical protein